MCDNMKAPLKQSQTILILPSSSGLEHRYETPLIPTRKEGRGLQQLKFPASEFSQETVPVM